MHPYKNEGLNVIYNLLFCDDINLYKENNIEPGCYPWSILFNADADNKELEKISTDLSLETRQRLLACHLLKTKGIKENSKELSGVIIEVGLDEGLDVLAAFEDGTARYINHAETMIVWETQTKESDEIIKRLFETSKNVVRQIGPWEKERKQPPANGMVRLSFLVSGEIYFGEGPFDVLAKDQMGGPVINAGIELMKFLIDHAEKKKN